MAFPITQRVDLVSALAAAESYRENPEYVAQVAANVRVEMARHRVSQMAIARHLKATQTYISRRVNGRVPFRAAELAAVAEFLDVPVADLLAAA